MAENPFQSVLNPSAHQANMWDLRMMSAANRMEAPFERGMGRAGGRGGLGGNPMLAGLMGMGNEPDYSSFTYDPTMRQQALNYGVTPLEASQVKQNVLLPNTGFFGRHPGLSGAIESALFGMAATPHSGGIQSVGEGISNAAEGVIGGARARRGMYLQQFARPFEAAGMMEHLEDLKQKRELQGAQIKRYEDESDIQRERAETERIKAGIPLERATATRPFTDPVTGQTYTFQEGGPPKLGPDMLVQGGQSGWKPLEGSSPGEIQRKAGQQNIWSGVGTDRTSIAREMGYTEPDTMKPKDWKRVNKEYERRLGSQSFQRGFGSASGREKVEGPIKESRARQDFIKRKLTDPKTMFMLDISPGDKDAAQKLGKWYDENIGMGTPETNVPTYNPNTGTLE